MPRPRSVRRRAALSLALIAPLLLAACAGAALGPPSDRAFGLQGRHGDCPEAPRSESFRKYQQLCGTRPNN